MIEINENFSIHKYKLHERRPGTFQGITTMGVDVTFPQSIRLVLAALIDRSTGKCEKVEEIISTIDKAVMNFKNVIDKALEEEKGALRMREKSLKRERRKNKPRE